ncbi:hypothetical protein EQ826_18010 [Ectopseudomonas mendocina]|nr:hypothetical protein EQ828_16820 [Pseudomonas mendocina]TRO23908.1 hypothetical protein EQ826_18010 [Pseudomonas mendocina]
MRHKRAAAQPGAAWWRRLETAGAGGNLIPPNRVGGGVAPAVLSHHRTYGSVYGGSGHTAKPSDRIQY